MDIAWRALLRVSRSPKSYSPLTGPTMPFAIPQCPLATLYMTGYRKVFSKKRDTACVYFAAYSPDSSVVAKSPMHSLTPITLKSTYRKLQLLPSDGIP